MVAAPSTSSGEIFRVVLLCVLWYGISSGNNVVGKVVLTHFPFPLTVTMVQLFSITVLSGPAFAIWGIRPYLDLPWTKYMTSIVPLACGKFVSSLMSHVSLWKVPVSYAHTGTYDHFHFLLIRLWQTLCITSAMSVTCELALFCVRCLRLLSSCDLS